MRRAALLFWLALSSASLAAQDDRATLGRAADDASERARQIEARVRAEDRAADRALEDASRAAARVAAAEARAAAARAQVSRIDGLRAEQQARLAAARAPLARLVAALQVMSRRPAALALAAPGSTADLIHVRLALDAALPEIMRRTAALRTEIAARDRLRLTAVNAVAARDAATEAVARERAAFVALAEARRGRAAGLSGVALAESDRALAFRADAREASLDRETRAAEAVLLGDLRMLLEPAPSGMMSAPNPPHGWGMPVAGRVVTGFGELTADGVRSRGVTLAVARDATVRAPAAGRVAWAGPFPGHGTIVILAHSGSRTTMVAGLARAAVREGQTVALGSRLGVAGRQVTIELRRGETPVDLAALASAPARDPVPFAP